MGLVSMKAMLASARRDGYAVGAFNTIDYASTKAVICAAEELGAPVIVQISVKTITHWGFEAIAGWMTELAPNAPVPVALHVDHCKDVEVIRRCIEAGWTSVMIDASALPFEENLAVSRQVVEMAAPAGVGVEAELGEIGGVEDDLSVAEEDAHLADPQKALAFCQQMDLAVFAPAIGTAHGVYKGEPKIAFDRLEEIYRNTETPLALHGGTGLPDDIIQRCIGLGCAKVNISTQLKHAFVDAFTEYRRDNPNDYEPLKIMAAQFDRIKAVAIEKIQQFGGAGRGLSAEVGL
jgi:fructose-bisphosphate aldolase class II/tagatose 1,6-diphosphate aldolase GatY/KbaY